MSLSKSNVEYVRNQDGSPGKAWNPVTGCYRNCPYCFARKFRFGKIADKGEVKNALFGKKHHQGKEYKFIDIVGDQKHVFPFGFTPTMYRYRLEYPLKIKKPQVIFVCYFGDLFAEWVPDDWIKEVLGVIRKTRQHVYLLLTKSPHRYLEFDMPFNVWLGQTIEGVMDRERYKYAYQFLKKIDVLGDWISFEPLLGDMENSAISLLTVLYDVNPDWVVIGAQTKPLKLPELIHVDVIDKFCEERKTPIFMKDNMKKLGIKLYQQLPEFTKFGVTRW